MDFYFPPEWFKPALVLTLISTGALVGLFAYLNRYTRRKYFGLWTLGWIFYGIWVVSTIAFLEVKNPAHWEWVNLASIGICALFLFWGALEFGGNVRRRREMGAVIFLMVFWSFAGRRQLAGSVWLSLPLYSFLAISSVMASVNFLMLRFRQGFLGASILCLGFLLFGGQMAVHPFLNQHISLLRPTLTVGASVTQVVIAVGMIVLMLEEVRGETNQLRSQLAADAELKKRLQTEIEIWEKHWAEAEQSRLYNLFEKSLNEVYNFDPQTLLIQYMNTGARRNLGFSAEEVQTMKPLDFQPEMAEGVFRGLVTPLLQKKEEKIIYYTSQKRKDGTLYPVEVHLQLIERLKGKQVFQAVVIDLTEIKRNKEALQESETRYRLLVESANDAIFLADEEGNLITWSKAAQNIFGYSEDEILKKSLLQLVPDRQKGVHRRRLERLKTTGSDTVAGTSIELYGQRKTGEEFPLEYSLSTWKTQGKTFFGVIIRDITERRLFEDRLQEQAELLNYARDMIIVTDLKNQVIYCNKSAERIKGLGKIPSDGPPPGPSFYASEDPVEFEKACKRVLEEGQWHGELAHRTGEDRRMTLDCRWSLVRDSSGKPTSILRINTDISGRKQLETQLIRAQRMESLGTLAGGIAHDLNNVLTPIAMSTGLLRRQIHDPNSKLLLENIADSVERGSEVVKQIQVFARGTEGKKSEIQIKHIVQEIEKILRQASPKSIEISRVFNSDLQPVLGDASQLHQALLNLCVNACQAMPNGGHLKIVAKNASLDEKDCGAMAGSQPGNYVCVSISDTGAGMPQEMVEKIFDPFFVFKDGKEIGMGLPTALGIVKSHGGFIHAQSKVGMGTTFDVYLPSPMASLVSEPEVSPEMLLGQGELILVVDDERTVREVINLTLKSYNYHVLTANDGSEAIAHFAQHRGKIQVVIMDMAMPVMDGVSSIRVLRKINPGIPIISISGILSGKQKEIEGLKTDDPHFLFLKKPFTTQSLLRSIRTVLSMNGKKENPTAPTISNILSDP